MQGASKEALAAAKERLDTLTLSTAVDARALADDLFSVTRVLDRSATLRRVLTDPARSGQDRADVLTRLLQGKVGEPALDLLAGLVRSRWSAAPDLSDAVESLAVLAEVTQAERDGDLDEVEDELFRFGRIVAREAGMRSLLADRTIAADDKVGVVRGLLHGRVTPTGERLLLRMVTDARGRSVEGTLAFYGRHAAERRSRLVAVVTAAMPLTREQKERLTAALVRLYGHEVHLNVEIDPEVVGGLRVRLGDEVIEGTLAERLERARRRLTG